MNPLNKQYEFLSNKLIAIVFFAMSTMIFLPDRPKISLAISTVLVIISFYTLLITDGSDQEDKQEKDSDKTQSSKTAWKGLAILFAALLHVFISKWLHRLGALFEIQPAKEIATFIIFTTGISILFFITYAMYKHENPDGKFSIPKLVLIPAICSLSILLPEYIISNYVDTAGGMIYIVLLYCMKVLILSPIILLVMHVKIKTKEPVLLRMDRKIGEVLLVPFYAIAFLANIGIIVYIYLYSCTPDIMKALYSIAIANVTVTVVFHIVYRFKEILDDIKASMALIGAFSLTPFIVYMIYVELEWYVKNDIFALVMIFAGMFAYIIVARIFSGSVPTKAYGVGKKCDRCNGEVSISARPGMKCPHCGVIWRSEHGAKRFLKQYHYIKAYCRMCGKRVHESSKVFSSCPRCKTQWMRDNAPDGLK